MSYISRCHPLCGWLRLQKQDYARTMAQLLRARDEYQLTNPAHSGPAPAYCDWVWDTELPSLAANPFYGEQFAKRVGDLEVSSGQLSNAIDTAIANKSAKSQEVERLRAAAGLEQ